MNNLDQVMLSRLAMAQEAATFGDYPLAAQQYEEAERTGCAIPAEEDETLLKIADYYGERDDYGTASVWYGKIHDMSLIEPYTLYYIGTLYRDGIAVIQDDIRALYFFRLAAMRNEPIALSTLGLLYRDGLCGLPVDLDEAEKLMQRGCLFGVYGNPAHVKELLDLYIRKYGDLKYIEHAIAFYEQLAEAPFDQEKYYELGITFETGYHENLDIRVEPEPERAIQYYRRSIEKSRHSKAAFRLGTLLLHGIGIDSDVTEAAKIFKEYASANVDAMNALGECYYSGIGVEQDYEKTFFYCSRAAEREHAEAQYNVGFCYEYGYGVSCDLLAAQMWYGRSAEQGFTLAIERIAEGFPDMVETFEGIGEPKSELLTETVGRLKDSDLEQNLDATVRLQEYSVELDETEDVNAMIARLKHCTTKEETFFLNQEIALKMAKGQMTVRIINDSIRIFVTGNTLIIDKKYARNNLTEMAIRYAVETEDDYLWLLPGNGYAVVYELPAILDEDQNDSILYQYMLRYCRDYLEEYLLYPNQFKNQLEHNRQRQL